jgi:hypothetical protein
MRRIAVGLAAALILAAFSSLIAASPASAAAKPAAPAVSKELRDKGKAAAPAMITAAGADCQMADARFIGDNTDPATKLKTSFYEVACTGGEGLVLAQAVDAKGKPTGKTQAFTCLETSAPQKDGKPSSLACILPGNLDPAAGLAPFLAKAGQSCAIDKARGIGHNDANTDFEVACHEGKGFIVRTSAPPRLDKEIVVTPCVMRDETSPEKCEFSTRAEQLAVVDRLTSASQKPCTIKDRGFLGVKQGGGAMFYEVACQEGTGYVLEQAPDGSLATTVDCSKTDLCKLTDTRTQKTEQAGLYTTLARKAGFECTVAKYAPYGVTPEKKELVELACSNRPDGAIGLFPASSAQPAEIYDCVHAGLMGYPACTLTKPEAAYPRLTDDLKTLGKTNCAVSGSRIVGASPDHLSGYIEVACADGLPGYVIEYNMKPLTPKSPLVCASKPFGGCTLPGNRTK